MAPPTQTRWVAGLYYLNIDNDSDNGLKFPVNSVVPGAPFDLGSDADLETDSYSLFGQVEYDLREDLTLIVGARVIQEEKDYTFSQNIYFDADSSQIHQGTPTLIGPTYPGGVPTAFSDDTSDTLWAGKLQLDWRLNDDWLLYAGVNRGVKAGSFNAQLAGGLPVPDSAIPYDEEKLLAYEVGFKSTWLNGTTRFNGSVFYYDYKDYQAFLFTGVGGVVINADATNDRHGTRAADHADRGPRHHAERFLVQRRGRGRAAARRWPDRPGRGARLMHPRCSSPAWCATSGRCSAASLRCRATSATRISSITTCVTSMPTSSTATRW